MKPKNATMQKLKGFENKELIHKYFFVLSSKILYQIQITLDLEHFFHVNCKCCFYYILNFSIGNTLIEWLIELNF